MIDVTVKSLRLHLIYVVETTVHTTAVAAIGGDSRRDADRGDGRHQTAVGRDIINMSLMWRI